MHFKIPKVDLRREGGSKSIDDENGNPVGQFLIGKDNGRTIILLSKYQGHFQSQAECEAFAKGVEAVLNHMTTYDRK